MALCVALWAKTMTNRVTVTHFDAWAPPTHEDYAVTWLVLYAMAVTLALVAVGISGAVRRRGR
jgi:hypothetical protein